MQKAERMHGLGMEHVGRLTNLASLNLSETYVTSGVVLHLIPLTQLRFLDLRATAVSEQAIARLSVCLNRKCIRSDYS